MNSFSFLYDLEKSLHTFEVRSDASRISALLSPHFYEFGSSGKIWTRDDILTRLPREDDSVKVESSGYRAVPLADDAVLVTYTSRRVSPGNEPVDFLRSSVWKKTDGRWLMVFHQGTRANV